MDLGRLRCFVAVAEEAHFTKAAGRLVYRTSHVSQQVRHLEQELGIQLFERTSRKVVLTADGEAMLRHARAILAEVGIMFQAADKLKAARENQLTIRYASGTGDTVAEIASELIQSRPTLQLRLGALTSLEVAEAVRSRKATVGVGYIAAPDLDTRVLSIRTFDTALLPAGHPLARRAHISLADLNGQTLITPERKLNPSLRQEFDRFFTDQSIFPRYLACPIKAPQDIVDLVSAGVGLSITMNGYFQTTPRVASIPLQGPTPQLTLLAMWYRGSCDPEITAFLEAAHRVELRRAPNAC